MNEKHSEKQGIRKIAVSREFVSIVLRKNVRTSQFNK